MVVAHFPERCISGSVGADTLVDGCWSRLASMGRHWGDVAGLLDLPSPGGRAPSVAVPRGPGVTRLCLRLLGSLWAGLSTSDVRYFLGGGRGHPGIKTRVCVRVLVGPLVHISGLWWVGVVTGILDLSPGGRRPGVCFWFSVCRPKPVDAGCRMVLLRCRLQLVGGPWAGHLTGVVRCFRRRSCWHGCRLNLYDI